MNKKTLSFSFGIDERGIELIKQAAKYDGKRPSTFCRETIITLCHYYEKIDYTRIEEFLIETHFITDQPKNDKSYSFGVSTEDKELINRVAEQFGVKPSTWVRTVLKDFGENYQAGNHAYMRGFMNSIRKSLMDKQLEEI